MDITWVLPEQASWFLNKVQYFKDFKRWSLQLDESRIPDV